MFLKSSLQVNRNMRTKWQQNVLLQENEMAREIRTMFDRSRETILADALGVVALIVILVGGLSLPSMM
jgi:hypothetical protein